MRLKMGRITVKNLFTYSYHGCYSEENEISRTSITLDENDDMKIRKNNSFLHDNVD